MNSLQDLIKRLTAIGQVNEAEEKCSDCGCTPCECDSKDKVDEAKKPDADGDGIPDWADKDKKEEVDEAKKPDADGDGVPDWADKKPGVDDKKEKTNEAIHSLMKRLQAIQESNLEEDEVEEGNEFSLELANAKRDGKKEFEVDGKKYQVKESDEVVEGALDKLKQFGKKALDTLGHGDDEDMIKDLQKKMNLPQTGKKPEPVKESEALAAMRRLAGMPVQECGMDMPMGAEMSPMSSVSDMATPVQVIGNPEAEPEMAAHAEPEMSMQAETPKPKFTLTIQNGDSSLNMTTDMPDEIIHIMKLAGVQGQAKAEKQAPGEEAGQEVEESGYENTPDNTKARDPQAFGDIRDWGKKGTGQAKPNYPGTKASGDNPMSEQAMMEDYKHFKAGK